MKIPTLAIVLFLGTALAQAAPRAQYLVRDVTQQTLGHKIGEKAFRSCDGSKLEIRDTDKIVDAPGESCDTLPDPVLAEAQIITLNQGAGQVVVEIRGFRNTLKVEKDILRVLASRKSKDTIAVLAIGGIPAEVAATQN